MRTYTISGLTEDQLVEIRNALELKARLGMGQTDDLIGCFPLRWRQHSYLLRAVRDLLGVLEKIVTESVSGYDSITSDNVPHAAKQAWDLYQVVRYHIAWAMEPQGGVYVRFDEPLPVLPGESLPVVTVESTGVELQEERS